MPIEIRAVYPTAEHARAAEAVTGFFSGQPEASALLLMGSCARGKASRDSCIDFLVLTPPGLDADRAKELQARWQAFSGREKAFEDLHTVGRFSHVDLDFIDGDFRPRPRGWTSGPDEFELEIGNALAYSAALWQGDGYLDRLKARWLPYYDEGLRAERLAAVRRYGLNNLDHIPLYVERGLYFQSFHRLYDAFREFLQALFIARRTYPIAYDKWVREQVAAILGMPDLYRELTHILEIERFEGRQVVEKAEALRSLYARYTVD